MSNLIFQLDTPITIANNGVNVEVSLLEVSEPTMLTFNNFVKVKSVVSKAMFEFQNLINTESIKASEGEESEKSDYFPIDMFAATNTTIELKRVVDEYLVKHGVWENDIKVREAHIKKIKLNNYLHLLEKVSYFLYMV